MEILEKAKSCYWPALQNVYMNVTQGEPDTIRWSCGGGLCGLSIVDPGALSPPREQPFSPLLGKMLKPPELLFFMDSFQC